MYQCFLPLSLSRHVICQLKTWFRLNITALLHVTFAFASTFTLASKFNIVSMVMQTEYAIRKIGLNCFLAQTRIHSVNTICCHGIHSLYQRRTHTQMLRVNIPYSAIHKAVGRRLERPREVVPATCSIHGLWKFQELYQAKS